MKLSLPTSIPNPNTIANPLLTAGFLGAAGET
jgi:hypothetical protein